MYAIARGYDRNDFDELRDDPHLKACNGRGTNGASLASQPSVARFEHRALRVGDLERVQQVLVKHPIRRWQRRGAPKMLVLDLDSADDPTHGSQQVATINGHLGTHCYQRPRRVVSRHAAANMPTNSGDERP